MTFYCVREKKKVEVEDYEAITTKNNRKAAKTTCPDCGCKMIRFLPSDPSRTDGEVVIKPKEND